MSLSASVKEFLETCDTDNTIIPFRPALVDITGSMYAACLLSQLLYWSRRSRNPDGWIYKTQKDLYRELRLNRYQLEHDGWKPPPAKRIAGRRSAGSMWESIPTRDHR